MATSRGFAQARVYIVIVVPQFQDTFTRTTSAPPFNLGTADTGQTWKWIESTTLFTPSFTESSSPAHVDGSTLVLDGSGSSVSDAFYDPPSIDLGEVSFDFWVPAAGDNTQRILYVDKNWTVAIYDSTTTPDTYDIYGFDTGIQNVPLTRSAWARLQITIVSNDVGGLDVYASVWTIGDSEPLPQFIQSSWPINFFTPDSPEYNAAPVIQFTTPTDEAGKLDNFNISAYFPFGPLVSANAQAYIQGANLSFGQAQTLIPGHYGFGQARVVILHPVFAQAQAHISRRQTSSGQAQCFLGSRKSVFGQANVSIIRVEPPAPIPSGRGFGPPEYVVIYDNYQLAGYPQSEEVSKIEQVDDFNSFNWDGSISQQAGLRNFTLTIEFLIYDSTGWTSMKEQYLANKARLLAPKINYKDLFVGDTRGAYKALVKSVNYQQPATEKFLKYVVEFECQPWLVSNVLRGVETFADPTAGGPLGAPLDVIAEAGDSLVILSWSPPSSVTPIDFSNTIAIIRTLEDGTWTPTTITVNGTNPTILAYTLSTDAIIEQTGYIAVTGGYVSGMIIDSEAMTTSVFGSNGDSYMAYIDYATYLGTGTTYFALANVDYIKIEWKNRW